jgi:putative PIN family toxin of toxin-antitoxin system
MRIILDTNVLISGIFFSGPPFEILDAWKHFQLQIVLTKEILEEYERVAESLSDKFPTIDILPIIELLTIHSHFIDAKDISISACDDPDDDKFARTMRPLMPGVGSSSTNGAIGGCLKCIAPPHDSDYTTEDPICDLVRSPVDSNRRASGLYTMFACQFIWHHKLRSTVMS